MIRLGANHEEKGWKCVRGEGMVINKPPSVNQRSNYKIHDKFVNKIVNL